MASKKVDNKSEFINDLAKNIKKWRERFNTTKEPECLEYAGAYEQVMSAVTAPETKKASVWVA